MNTRWKPRFSYANVMSSIAVFIALGGSAFAAGHLITTNDIANQAVTSAKMRDGAVTPQKLRNQSVRPIKLARNAVFPAHLRNFAVRPMKIAPGAVFPPHLRDGAVIQDKIAPGAVTGEKIAPEAIGTGNLSPGIHGVALAGAKVVGGNIASWFNRFGGQPSVQTPAAGVRVLTFPGLEGGLGGNNVIHMATLRGPAPGLINARNVGGNPEVRTSNINAAGNNSLSNRGFNYVVYGTTSGPGSP